MSKNNSYSLNCYKDMKYANRNIEKILYVYTRKCIKVLSSYSDTQNQPMDHNAVTNKLIEQINLYLEEQKQVTDQESVNHAQYYLVVNFNHNQMVDISYLGYFHYSNKEKEWQLDIIPLINFASILQQRHYIYDELITISVNIIGSKIRNDSNIIETHKENLIEHVKLRIEYPTLHVGNFESYKLKFTNIYSQTPEYLATMHNVILEQYDAMQLDVVQVSGDAIPMCEES